MAVSFTTAIRSMKKYLLWSFERGSRPYDVICLVILAFIFLTPSWVFHDRPEFMRVDSEETVRRTVDDNGSVIYTVPFDRPAFISADTASKIAVDRLHETIHDKFSVSRAETIRNSRGEVIACAV